MLSTRTHEVSWSISIALTVYNEEVRIWAHRENSGRDASSLNYSIREVDEESLDTYSGEIPVRNSILVTASTTEWSKTKHKGLVTTHVHTITRQYIVHVNLLSTTINTTTIQVTVQSLSVTSSRGHIIRRSTVSFVLIPSLLHHELVWWRM